MFLLWRSTPGTPGTGRCECESCPGPGVSVRVELGAAKTLIISHSSTALHQVNTGHRPPWRNGDISSQHHTFTQEPLTTSLRNNFQPQAFTQNLTLLQRNHTQPHTFTQKSITVLYRNHLKPYTFMQKPLITSHLSTQEPLTASHFYTGTTFNLTLLHRNINLGQWLMDRKISV